MIQDKYASLDVSRQRKYQLRQRDAGKCITCGKARVTTHHCAEHAALANQLAKAAYKRAMQTLDSQEVRAAGPVSA